MSLVYREVETERWRLQVPRALSPDSPLVCVPTIHPRGDQRILRCTQVLLDAGFRVEIIWEGNGTPSTDLGVYEHIIPKSNSFAERISKLGRLTLMAFRSSARNWHIHDFYMLPSALLARMRGIRTIYDVHEYYPEYYSSKLPAPLRPIVAGAISRFQVSVARKVGGANVVAERMSVPFRDRGVPLAISPNYPSHTSTPDATNESRSGAIHIGTLSPTYGMVQLIDVAVHLHRLDPTLTIDLVKRFPNKATEERFYKLLESANILGSIRLLEPVRPSEVPALLNRYVVGLSTILDAGQNEIAIPTKLYEYVNAGLTTVGTRRPAQEQFLAEWGRSELLSDEDSLGMAVAIVAAHTPVAMEEASAKAVLAKQHLHWEKGPANSLKLLVRSVFGHVRFPGPS